MKNLYVLTLAFFAFVITANAQISSDDPIFKPGPSIGTPMMTNNAMLRAVSGTITPCDSGAATLIATGGCDFVWTYDSAGTNVITTSDTLITSTLYSDTSFWLQTLGASALDSMLPFPAQTGTFSGNVRGYYFQAPTDFYITGLRVPTDASNGAQNVAVLDFGGTPPPLWSSTTNAFTELGYWANYTGPDTIRVCFQIDSGNYIGIYGNRNDVNSYLTAPVSSMIAGQPVTLTRSGMQLPLSTNPMQNVFSESAGSISRVEMYYSLTSDTTSELINVIVPQTTSGTASVDICDGETAMINGNPYTMDTVVTDSLMNIGGCDSIVTTTLTVNPTYNYSNGVSLCPGDSILIGGTYYSSSTVVVDSNQTVMGCDSIVTVAVQAVSGPTVTIGNFPSDTVCSQAGLLQNPAGTPAGGTYSGPGVTGNDFDPAVAGVGSHTINYTYTDSNGCSDVASTMIYVMDCTGIELYQQQLISIYPNPVQDVITIDAKGHVLDQIRLTDATGRTVMVTGTTSGRVQFDLGSYASGVYFLIVENGNQQESYKVIKR